MRITGGVLALILTACTVPSTPKTPQESAVIDARTSKAINRAEDIRKQVARRQFCKTAAPGTRGCPKP